MTGQALLPDTLPSASHAHCMRITSAGSINSYVRFALSFLQANPDRSLILHTRSIPTASDASSEHLPASSSTLTPSLLNTPKLISVIEIIKREYISRLTTSEKGKGKNKAKGIWQYTETGLLPVLNVVPENGLVRVLEGKTKPKMTHNPYLQVTLSTKPLGLEAAVGVTCQYVLARRRRNRGNGKSEAKIGSELEEVVIPKDGERSEAEDENNSMAASGREGVRGRAEEDEDHDPVSEAQKVIAEDGTRQSGSKRKSSSSQEPPKPKKRLKAPKKAKPVA